MKTVEKTVADCCAIVGVALICSSPAFAVSLAPEPEVVGGVAALAGLTAGYRLLKKAIRR